MGHLNRKPSLVFGPLLIAQITMPFAIHYSWPSAIWEGGKSGSRVAAMSRELWQKGVLIKAASRCWVIPGIDRMTGLHAAHTGRLSHSSC